MTKKVLLGFFYQILFFFHPNHPDLKKSRMLDLNSDLLIYNFGIDVKVKIVEYAIDLAIQTIQKHIQIASFISLTNILVYIVALF